MKSFARSVANASRQQCRIRVSFDLDDTLTSHCCKVPVEKSLFPPFIHHWLGEPLRRGTKRLFRELRHDDCSVWIYTSSKRSPAYIQRWFLLHGIRIDGVVNGYHHHHALNRRHLQRLPSKFPPAFGIDLHVDNSEGVKMEGDELGFRVLVIHPHDERWMDKVLDAVASLRPA